MNFREIATRTLYLLLSLASIATGLWLLVDPAGSNAVLQVQVLTTNETGLIDPLQVELLRKLGATYLCVSLAFLWCLKTASVRVPVHSVLVLFFGLIAAIELGELAATGEPSLAWFAIAPLALLPPLVLLLMPLLMWVRLPPMPSMPSRGETGVVKWFDTRKGFGFITRSNGDELFVHFRSIRADGKGAAPRALRDGQAVRFRVGEGKKGPQAEDVVPLG